MHYYYYYWYCPVCDNGPYSSLWDTCVKGHPRPPRPEQDKK
jgi:hypothetical protein